MKPTDAEVDELLAEIRVKTIMADALHAADPQAPSPRLPLSPRAAKIALALLEQDNRSSPPAP